MAQRLALIFETIQSIIQTYKPAAMALEEVFTFKNPRSALKLAQARAAALLPAALAGIPIFEYAPQLIKKTVTGSGRAEKSQVAFMVGKILGINEILAEDASDALAIAICHSGQDNLPNTSGAVAAAGRLRGSSWRRMSVSDLKALGYRLEDDS
jgi:crossover junction endodeoxyribonuclease RuvC